MGLYVYQVFAIAGSCKRAQSCLTLCDCLGCSPPDSSVHGMVQAKILEWVAISYSKGSSQHRGLNCVSCIFCIGRWVPYPSCHLGSPAIPGQDPPFLSVRKEDGLAEKDWA